MFQFHTGSIKSDIKIRRQVRRMFRFNSILVRLKVDFCGRDTHEVTLFQFHTGSIKRCAAVAIKDVVRWFQFHTGSIKRVLEMTDTREVNVCFNSILVRLKGYGACGRATSRRWFQFHTGSIKREFGRSSAVSE